jgi:hypothetical protein
LSNVARGWAEEKKSVRSVSGDEVKEACRMMKYHLWLRNVLRIPPRKLGYLPGELKQLVEARVSAANLPALAVFRRAAAGTDDEDYIQSLEGELPESALVEEDNGEMVNVTWTALLASTYKELVGKKPDDTLPRLAPHAKRAMPTNSQIYERVANLLGMEDDSVRSALKRAGIKISDL